MHWNRRRGASRRFLLRAPARRRAVARRRFLARLGARSQRRLDEFLNVALEYERRETPSLQGFLTWLRAARAEVKRDMEIARDEVRVMTVHGAKGLEAPIVILADTMTQPAGDRAAAAAASCRRCVIWAGRKDDDVTRSPRPARCARIPKPRTNIAASSTSP